MLFPHAQGEHSLEVWAGNGQQGSVSRDPLAICDQDHIAELVLLPLLIEALQHLHSLVIWVENLPIKNAKHTDSTPKNLAF